MEQHADLLQLVYAERVEIVLAALDSLCCCYAAAAEGYTVLRRLVVGAISAMIIAVPRSLYIPPRAVEES